MIVNQLPHAMRRAFFAVDFRLVRAVLGAGLFLFFSGCAGEASRAKPPSSPSPTPQKIRHIVGAVAVVNEAEHFVLVDLGSSLYVPVPGEDLRATGPAGEVAQLKASPEQKRPFIAAEIIDGTPKVGDEVTR